MKSFKPFLSDIEERKRKQVSVFCAISQNLEKCPFNKVKEGSGICGHLCSLASSHYDGCIFRNFIWKWKYTFKEEQVVAVQPSRSLVQLCLYCQMAEVIGSKKFHESKTTTMVCCVGTLLGKWHNIWVMAAACFVSGHCHNELWYNALSQNYKKRGFVRPKKWQLGLSQKRRKRIENTTKYSNT